MLFMSRCFAVGDRLDVRLRIHENISKTTRGLRQSLSAYVLW